MKDWSGKQRCLSISAAPLCYKIPKGQVKKLYTRIKLLMQLQAICRPVSTSPFPLHHLTQQHTSSVCSDSYKSLR